MKKTLRNIILAGALGLTSIFPLQADKLYLSLDSGLFFSEGDILTKVSTGVGIIDDKIEYGVSFSINENVYPNFSPTISKEIFYTNLYLNYLFKKNIYFGSGISFKRELIQTFEYPQYSNNPLVLTLNDSQYKYSIESFLKLGITFPVKDMNFYTEFCGNMDNISINFGIKYQRK